MRGIRENIDRIDRDNYFIDEIPAKLVIPKRSIPRSVLAPAVGTDLITVDKGEHYRPSKVPADHDFSIGAVGTVDEVRDVFCTAPYSPNPSITDCHNTATLDAFVVVVQSYLKRP